MVKTTGAICPQCGEVHNIKCYDYECNCGNYYGAVIKHFECHKCDNTWKEFYVLVYDGYVDAHGCYDVEGEAWVCTGQ